MSSEKSVEGNGDRLDWFHKLSFKVVLQDNEYVLARVGLEGDF